jgi:deoxyxylulose-5-phosphate synthase
MNFKNLGFIYIYLVDYQTMKTIYPILKNHYNHNYNGFIDINKMKQLTLKNGETLKTLHFYHSNNPKDLISIDEISNEYKFFSVY